MNKESYPVGSKIRFEFPARNASISVLHPHLFHHHTTIQHDAMTLFWYDGGQPNPNPLGGHDLSNKPPIEVDCRHRRTARRSSRQWMPAYWRSRHDFFARTITEPVSS